MKRALMISGIIFVISFIVFGITIYRNISNTTEMILSEEIEALSFEQYDDGVYEGEYYLNDIGICVSLEIEDGQVVSIDYSNHMNGKGDKAELINEDIIEDQSILVDDIAGATISSRCIKLAIINALEGEENE